MAEKQKTPLGPTGETLRQNIRRIRESQRLTYVELSERLTDVGRPIPVLGLRRIERGERRVDVDDLAALAVVLRAFPVDLLVPGNAADDDPYGVTPEVTTTSAAARDWISGAGFLSPPETPMDFAVAIQSMPKARAQAVSKEWFTPERQQESNRQALEYDRQQAEERQDSVYGHDEPQGDQ